MPRGMIQTRWAKARLLLVADRRSGGSGGSRRWFDLDLAGEHGTCRAGDDKQSIATADVEVAAAQPDPHVGAGQQSAAHRQQRRDAGTAAAGHRLAAAALERALADRKSVV